MTRRRMRVAVGVLVAAVALVLSGCQWIGPRTETASPSATPDLSDVPEALLPFYGQELTWESCAGGGPLTCTTVTAPMDWDDPGAGEIELAVVRRAAENGMPIGSLLTNPGGPGASGFDFVADFGDVAFGDVLADHYDLIGFDPRGVGRSTAVRCLDAEAMDSYLFDIPEAERGTDDWFAEVDARAAGFAAACADETGALLEFITTEQSARDMDLLRAVLGDATINYLGFSYGTSLGSTYADLFPERVGRMVLDAAVDPTVDALESGTTQAVGFESALRAYLEDCLDGRDCPFAGTVDDALADVGALLAAVDARPLPGPDGRMLGADTLLTAIVTALYSEQNWPLLTGALAETLQGEAETAFLLADFYYDRQGGQYLSNQTEAFTAYNCMDYPDDLTPEQEEQIEALIAEKAPTIAPYWIGGDTCAQWAFAPSGTREARTAEGAAPILVIGTTNDPATPYEWAVSLADQLSSGILITREGEGHTGFQQGNACVDRAVEAYFVDDITPEDDLVCR